MAQPGGGLVSIARERARAKCSYASTIERRERRMYSIQRRGNVRKREVNGKHKQVSK